MCEQVYGNIFLITAWYGRSQSTVGSGKHGEVILGCKIMQSEQASKQSSSIAFVSVPATGSYLELMSDFL